jgi:glutathione peroxidase-family protein
MKPHFVFYILLSILFLTGCGNEKSYVVEGNVDGLTSSTIYVVTSLDNKTGIDTLFAKEGKFKFISSYDSVKPIIIYMEDQTVWITVWAQNGETITVSGNVNDPELIKINGNVVNDLLTEFKQRNKEIDKDTLIFRAERFVKEHPASIAALVVIQDYLMEKENPDVLGNYLSFIENPAKKDLLYKRLNTVYQRILQTSVGHSAPDFSVVDVKGDTLTLKAFENRYLLLAFESFACKSYDENLSVLKKLDKKYSDKKLAILSIAFDEENVDWKEISRKYNISWLQVIDKQGLASFLLALYNVNILPDYFLIDNQGKIIAAHDSITKIETILKEHIK